MSGPQLVLERLEKSYGAILVTASVSLTVQPGEALGILGPNGAGKTTLFGLISGAVRADAGEVWFNGRQVSGLPSHARCRLGIARTHQIPRPFTELTVFENLLVGARFGVRGVHPAGLCADILRRTGLAAKADLPARSLTLLERKRLELARALAARPRLLLLDEIAGGLTEAECLELVAVVRDIRSTGVTIIWVEHVLHALLNVVERLLVLNFGAVVADGPCEEVMQRPDVHDIYLGSREAA